jgi:hypothetical protein
MADEPTASPDTAPVTAAETPAPAAAPAKAAPPLDRVAAFLAKQGEDAPAEGDEEKTPTPAELDAKDAKEGGDAEKPAEDPGEKVPDLAAQRRSFAALSRQQKELKRQEAALGDVRTKAQQFDQLGAQWEADPVAVIAQLMRMPGQRELAVNKFLEGYIARGGAGGPKEPGDAERIAALEKRLQDGEQARMTAERERVIEGNKSQMRQMVTAAGDRFDLLNAYGLHDQVWDNMVAYYAANQAEIEARGISLDPLQFAEKIEKELEAEAQRVAARSKKIQFGRSTPTDKQGAPAGIPRVAAPAATARTLTNSQVSTGPAPKVNGAPRETLEQRQARVRREMNLS